MGPALTKMGKVLDIYNALEPYPMGKWIFSLLFCLAAPYFFSISPQVNEMKPGYSSVTLRQRWLIQNHIGTVHAIAVCNLIEMALGLVVEATVPDSLRWLPMGMDVKYLKKASGVLTASATLPPSAFDLPSYPAEVGVPVEVHNSEGILVSKAEVKIWVSVRPIKEDRNSNVSRPLTKKLE
eukprot:gene28636-34572_t